MPTMSQELCKVLLVAILTFCLLSLCTFCFKMHAWDPKHSPWLVGWSSYFPEGEGRMWGPGEDLRLIGI